MKVFGFVLLCLLLGTISASAFVLHGGGPASAPPSYTPLCGGANPACAYAYSTERQMVSGATTAFQVYRSVDGQTQDVGFTGAGLVNTATVDTFCNAAVLGVISRNCFISQLYDETGNACVLFNSTSTAMPDYMVDPARQGLPRLQKVAVGTGQSPPNINFILDSGGGSTGAPAHRCNALTGSAQALFFAGNSSYASFCCGFTGLMETVPASGPTGAMFAAYAGSPNIFDNCTTPLPGGGCGGIDSEGQGPQANYTRTVNDDFIEIGTTASSTGPVNIWINNAQTTTNEALPTALVTKDRMVWGHPGDWSNNGPSIFRSAAFYTSDVAASQASLYSNETSFAATLTAGYKGPGDVVGGETSYSTGVTNFKPVQLQWLSQCFSLRKCYAGYEGPALNVCQGTGACEDIGWVNNTIDTATMSAYCGPVSGLNNCTVQVWYNQALNQSSSTNGVGTGIDATTASTRPVVLWSGCGTTAITVCIATSPTNYFVLGGGITVTGGYTMSAVAMRTSGSSASAILSSVSTPTTFIGFAGANTCTGTASASGTPSTVACNDNAVHSITVDAPTSPSGSVTTYADGVAGSAATVTIGYSATGLGVGATAAGIDPCTCQLSEVLVYADAHNISFNTALGSAGVAALRANQQAVFGFGGGMGYQGPCDVITGGCAEAYSVTRAMTSAYSGNLFQLVRLSDSAALNVGMTNDVVNTSGVAAFCQNTYCLYNLVYGQINGNTWHAPIRSIERGATPVYCTTSTSCDPLWWIDLETGLPAIRTPYPAGFIGPHTSTGISGGTHAISMMMDGRNDAYTSCCGQFLVGHNATQADTIGTIFGMQFSYDAPTYRFIECSTNYTFCAGGEYEEQHNYADYGSSLENVIQTITWDGAAATNTVKDYVNGVVIGTWSPPSANCGSPLPACKNGGAVGNGINLGTSTQTSIGYGGDNSHSDAIFREGLITNGVINSGDEASARANMTTFYSAYHPNACQSVADMSYFFSASQTNNDFGDGEIGSALVALGLRQMRASQTGPIVALRDVVTNVINIYGPASSGCGLDPAAAMFCATNGCAVATLYNQGTYSTGNPSSASFYDTTLSFTAASTAAQPTVTFNSLNGKPTMHFTGTQMLCSGTIPEPLTTAVPTGWSVVAQHASGSGTGAVASHVYTTDGSITAIGWGSGADTFNYSVSAASGPQLTGTASDGQWHQMGWESTSSAGTAGNSYVDGTTIASGVTVGASGNSIGAGTICLGGVSGAANFSGDIAEFVISAPRSPISTGFATLEPTIFAFDEIAWGTLQGTSGGAPVITFNAPAASYTYPSASGFALTTVTATVSTGSFLGGGGTFTSSNCAASNIAVASAGAVTVAGPGNLSGSQTCLITAHYPAATDVTQTFTLTGTQQTIASISPCSLGGGCSYSFTPSGSPQTLGPVPTVTMSGGISFSAGSGTIVLGVGLQCSAFSISGSNLQITEAGAVTDACTWVITDASASNSPQTVNITANGGATTNVIGAAITNENVAPASSPGTVIGDLSAIVTGGGACTNCTWAMVNSGTSNDGAPCAAASNNFQVSSAVAGVSHLEVLNGSLAPIVYGAPPTSSQGFVCARATPAVGSSYLFSFSIMVRGNTFTSVSPRKIRYTAPFTGTLATLSATVHGTAAAPVFALSGDAACSGLSISGASLNASSYSGQGICHYTASQAGVTCPQLGSATTPAICTVELDIEQGSYTGPCDTMAWRVWAAPVACGSAIAAAGGPIWTVYRERDYLTEPGTATLTVNALANGDMDLATLATFCDTSICYMHTAVDQSGHTPTNDLQAYADLTGKNTCFGSSFCLTIWRPQVIWNAVNGVMPMASNSNSTDRFMQNFAAYNGSGATGTLWAVAMQNSGGMLQSPLMNLHSVNVTSNPVTEIQVLPSTGWALYVGPDNQSGGSSITAAAAEGAWHEALGVVNTSSSSFKVDGSVNAGTLLTANLIKYLGFGGGYGGGNIDGGEAAAGVSDTVTASLGQLTALCTFDSNTFGVPSSPASC